MNIIFLLKLKITTNKTLSSRKKKIVTFQCMFVQKQNGKKLLCSATYTTLYVLESRKRFFIMLTQKEASFRRKIKHRCVHVFNNKKNNISPFQTEYFEESCRFQWKRLQLRHEKVNFLDQRGKKKNYRQIWKTLGKQTGKQTHKRTILNASPPR